MHGGAEPSTPQGVVRGVENRNPTPSAALCAVVFVIAVGEHRPIPPGARACRALHFDTSIQAEMNDATQAVVRHAGAGDSGYRGFWKDFGWSIISSNI